MHEKLASQEVAQALEDIHQPDFSAWARYAFSIGQLELITQTIIRCGRASNNVDAIKYLAGYQNGDNQKVAKVTWGDMTRTSSSRILFKKLNELISEKTKTALYDRSRYYGVISHIAVPKLLFGELIPDVSVKKIRNSPGRQMSIFAQPSKPQMLFTRQKYGSNTRLLDTIEREWKVLREKMQEGTLPVHHQVYKKLCGNLSKIFGQHLQDVLSHGVLNEEIYAFKTVMIWAAALMYYRTIGPQLFFRELWVLPNKCDVGAGRLDALVVKTMNGQAPTPQQMVYIRKIIIAEKFSSVGHAIARLVQLFPGTYFHFEIDDWKFAVGDGPKGIYQQQINIIEADQIREHPFPEHVNQLKRYLSLTMLSYRLASRRPGDFWDSKSFSISGKVVYLVPDGAPITHSVNLTKEESKSVFVEQLANNFRLGKQQRLLVFYSNRYLNHAIHLLSEVPNGKTAGPTEIPSIEPMKQLAFEGIPTQYEAREKSLLKIEPLIEEHRQHVYKDEYQIIEVVGKNRKDGSDAHKMHYNRLTEQVDAGNLKASKEFLQKGYKGHVQCPLHQERTPSMSINFAKDLFKCFSCGISGQFFPESIPNDMQLGLRSGRVIVRETKEIQKLVVPLRHQEIMRFAQRSLQRGFLDSPGAAYLGSERRLYPELSLQDGAGYGSLRCIEEMLEEGISYDELLWYGFLGLSQHVKESDPLIGLLSKRYPNETLAREIHSAKKDEQLFGLPYFLLEGRVTYPLEIAGVINTFYGRSVDPNCPKQYRHRKLIIDNTNIPHGAYRMHASMQKQVLKTHAKIVVVESPINADTVRVMCNDAPATTAIIGVNNDILFEVLASFEGDIVVAFDNDPAKYDESGKQLFKKDGAPEGMTGQKNTLLFAEKVRRYGFRGNVLDFTAAFTAAHPKWNFSDLNQFWVDYGERINFFDYVKTVRVP